MLRSVYFFLLVTKQIKKQAKVAAIHKPKAYGIKPLHYIALFIPFPFGVLSLAQPLIEQLSFFLFFLLQANFFFSFKT
jgi:hypothetical protein